LRVVVVVLLGVVVVVDFTVVVVVDFTVVVVDFTVVVVDFGVVVLGDSFGAVVLVVPLPAGVVVVVVAEGTTVVVEFAGDDVFEGSLATVPAFPDVLETPDEPADDVVEVTRDVVVIDDPEAPPEPLARLPDVPSVDCGAEKLAAPGDADDDRSAATVAAVAAGG
jgi:hypothetical protein